MQTPQPADKALSHEERDQYIQNCSEHFLAAYGRFEDHGLPCDRDEAYQWLHMRDAAVIERLLDEGLDFFAVQGTADRAKLRETTSCNTKKGVNYA